MDNDRTIRAHARWSRRALLHRAVGLGLTVAAGGAWLTACGGNTTPAPPSPTVVPSAALTVPVPPSSAPTLGAATSTPAAPVPLRLRYGSAPQHFGDLRLPAGAGPHPVALVLHGGGWSTLLDVENTAPICAALAVRSIATWNIEYRRLGNPGGGWPGTFLDVATAADHLRVLARDYPLDLARVVVVGDSSGGHLALWLGGRRIPAGSPLAQPDPLSVRAVIALAGIPDLTRAWDLRLASGAVRDLLGGTPEDYPDRYAAASPRALLPLGTRQVLVHGEIDQTVPFQLAVDYQAAATASGDDATLLALPRTGHGELVRTNSEAWQRAQAAIVAALAP